MVIPSFTSLAREKISATDTASTNSTFTASPESDRFTDRFLTSDFALEGTIQLDFLTFSLFPLE